LQPIGEKNLEELMKTCGRMGFCQTEVTCFVEELSVLHRFDQDMQSTSLQMNIGIRKRKKQKLYFIKLCLG
jgi:hypothetical protein